MSPSKSCSIRGAYGRVAFAEARLTDARGTHLASATSTLMILQEG
ncbi:MAG: hypothetical protein NTX28_07275 [Novosphingobium sp.]|nr:hypothetical protein [Novosphingobium sp.]